MLFRIVFFTLSLSLPLFSAEENQKSTKNVAELSEAFGHMIGKNIETLGIKVDIAHVVKGLEDAANGKESPMTEAECIQALSAAQEEAHQELAKENLEKAEDFLTKNEKKSGVVTVEKGKLQYKIEAAGSGARVEASASPVIRYVGKYLDGSVFGSSQKDETLSLEETIPGFSKGLVGMKEGEKRTLYIHPDYGYGTQGYLPPNSLLVFEIEVVKADTVAEEESATEPTAKTESAAQTSTELSDSAVR